MSQKVYLDRPKRLNWSPVTKAFGFSVRVFLDCGFPKPNIYEDKTHALCLSGYQITQEGFFNIQAIDSNFGIYWLSLEHLLSTRKFNHSFVLYKRCIDFG